MSSLLSVSFQGRELHILLQCLQAKYDVTCKKETNWSGEDVNYLFECAMTGRQVIAT